MIACSAGLPKMVEIVEIVSQSESALPVAILAFINSSGLEK